MAFAGGFPGKKPRTPHPRILRTDAAAVQKKTLEGNIANFPDISKLSDLYSKEELGQIEKVLPGYTSDLQSGKTATESLLNNAQSYLSGEIPQDVQDAVQRSSAYTALSGGYAGSPMSRALTARDLGLTSLDLQKTGANMLGQGVNSMQAWDSLARRNMLNPGSMLVTPQQGIAVDQQNRVNTYNALQNSYNIQAQPNPLHNIIMSLTEAYLGSVGVGGKGGGGGAPSGGADSSGGGGSQYANQSGLFNSGASPNYNFNNQYVPTDSQYDSVYFNRGLSPYGPQG